MGDAQEEKINLRPGWARWDSTGFVGALRRKGQGHLTQIVWKCPHREPPHVLSRDAKDCAEKEFERRRQKNS